MDIKSTKRITMFFVGGLFSLLITVITFYLIYICTWKAFQYGRDVGGAMSAERPSRSVEITIAKDATFDDVTKLLKQKGVIENTLIFKLECVLKGIDGGFEAGTYTIDASMDSNEIVAALREAETLAMDVKITILEGYSAADITSYLEDKEIVGPDDFLEACTAGEFDYAFLDSVPERVNPLEGYLFPDTYFISPNADSMEIINKMLARFDEMYDAECKAVAEQAGLTMDQVVTIASIIEKEVRIPEERAKVSALIKNRLALDMPLDMPSTVVYVLDKGRKRLTEADLQAESPYNTYVGKGLPAGPISNPGKACIDAALNPDDSDVLYFVLTDDETGEHFFTSDKAAFLEAKELYGQIY